MKTQEKTVSTTHNFDVIIVGGGASGTALLYALTRYTDIKRIALIEKYSTLGSVNSNATNNSQTLHVGDIETNYTIGKTREVYPASMMIKRYTDGLSPEARKVLIQPVPKMVLGVGAKEVGELEERYPSLKEVFKKLEKLDAPGIALVEPEVMRGRDPDEPVCALFNPEGYAVNFGALAKSFADEAVKHGGERVSLFLNTKVDDVVPGRNGCTVHANGRLFTGRVVVFDTDAYSLGFAKKLGLGKEFSLIPIAGTFFFTPQKLRGKVYRVQAKRMPFAAVHGDPDLTKQGMTRWGPTARFYPVLEARNLRTMFDFFRFAGLHRVQTWVSFLAILLEPIRFWYLFKNFLYDLPIVGKHVLLPELKKIIPTLSANDLTSAQGYGGMRLQRVDTRTKELLLGEGKIIGNNIIFNMTPSPGASVSLYNAMRDIDHIKTFLPEYLFEKERMLKELCVTKETPTGDDVSLNESYAS